MVGALATARRLGWSCSSYHEWEDDVGQKYDLCVDSFALLSPAVGRSVARWRLARACRAAPAARPDGPAITVTPALMRSDDLAFARGGPRLEAVPVDAGVKALLRGRAPLLAK